MWLLTYFPCEAGVFLTRDLSVAHCEGLFFAGAFLVFPPMIIGSFQLVLLVVTTPVDGAMSHRIIGVHDSSCTLPVLPSSTPPELLASACRMLHARRHRHHHCQHKCRNKSKSAVSAFIALGTYMLSCTDHGGSCHTTTTLPVKQRHIVP